MEIELIFVAACPINSVQFAISLPNQYFSKLIRYVDILVIYLVTNRTLVDWNIPFVYSERESLRDQSDRFCESSKTRVEI